MSYIHYKEERLTGLVTSCVGTKIRQKERYMRREEEREGVGSYWETLRKRGDT